MTRESRAMTRELDLDYFGIEVPACIYSHPYEESDACADCVAYEEAQAEAWRRHEERRWHRQERRTRGLALEAVDPWRSAAETLLRESGCLIRAYREDYSGVALTRSRHWWIDCPRVYGAEGYSVFAHEVGHHLLHRADRGHVKSTPRWLEEIEAWDYSFSTFERFDLPEIEWARTVAVPHLLWMVRKASRRGASFEAMPEHWRDTLQVSVYA